MEVTVHSTFPYELRIGVTGHRSASGVMVEEAVRKLFDRIIETLSVSATPLSLVVVSPLAVGADRLVARVAMDYGAKLEVIAPLPVKEYRKDFVDPTDLADFDALLGKATSRKELPLRGDSSTIHAKTREQQYRSAGEQVVDASEILIAVWNGLRESGTGGTAQIIRYAIETGRVVLWIHANLPQLAPLWIRDVSNIEDTNRPARRGAQFPRSSAELSRGYTQQAEYCVNAAVDSALLETSRAAIANQLRSPEGGRPSPFDVWEAALSPLVREHARADLLAISYGQRHASAVNRILTLTAVGVTIAVTQVLFFKERTWIALFEVAAMLIVLWTWWRSRRRAWHDKWLSNRYLAEGFRSAIFTSLARPARGPEDSESKEPLRFYEGPQHWLSSVVSHSSRSAASKIGETDFESVKDFIATAWIDGQYRFHADNADRKKKIAHRRHRLGTFFLPPRLSWRRFMSSASGTTPPSTSGSHFSPLSSRCGRARSIPLRCSSSLNGSRSVPGAWRIRSFRSANACSTRSRARICHRSPRRQRL